MSFSWSNDQKLSFKNEQQDVGDQNHSAHKYIFKWTSLLVHYGQHMVHGYTPQ